MWECVGQDKTLPMVVISSLLMTQLPSLALARTAAAALFVLTGGPPGICGTRDMGARSSLALVVHPKLAHKVPLTTNPLRLDDLPPELLKQIAVKVGTAKDLCAFQCTNSLLR